MNVLRRAVTSRLLTWASRSLLGNVVLFEILLGLPSFVMFSYMDYERGILTPMRMIFVCVICLTEGLMLGAIIWFGVTRPAINRKLNKSALHYPPVSKEPPIGSGVTTD